MNARCALATFLIALAWASPTARAQSERGAEIVVEVNGVPVTRADFDVALAMSDEWRELARQGSSAKASALRTEVERRVLDAVIDEVLFSEAARARKITFTPEEEREIRREFDARVKERWGSVDTFEQFLKANGLELEKFRARRRLLRFVVPKLVQSEPGVTILIRPSELRAYYDAHRDAYLEPGRAEISLVKVRRAGRSETEAHSLIEAALRDLGAGKSFAEVAMGYPDGPYYENGGHWSVPKLTDLAPKELLAATLKLKEGQTSGIVEAPGGYFIVKLEKLVTDRYRSFEQVQDEIYKELEAEAINDHFKALRTKLREKAYIKYHGAPGPPAPPR